MFVSNVAVTAIVSMTAPQASKIPTYHVEKYNNHQTDTNTYSTPDKVTEPLTRLFTNIMQQIRLLTPL